MLTVDIFVEQNYILTIIINCILTFVGIMVQVTQHQFQQVVIHMVVLYL